MLRAIAVLVSAASWMWAGVATAAEVPLLGNSWVTWGTSATAFLYDVDKHTGLATNPRNTGLQTLVGISPDPATGVLYGLTVYQSALYEIDRGSGQARWVGTTGIAGVEGDLDFDPTTGLLYGIQWVPSGTSKRLLFTISKNTGQATSVGDITGSDLSAMAFDANGDLYILDTGRDELLHVNKHTAAIISRVSCATALGSTAGMDFDPVTGTLYVADGATDGTNRLYTLDPTTGAMGSVGALGVSPGFAGLAFAVPEPITTIMIALGDLVTTRRRPGAASGVRKVVVTT